VLEAMAMALPVVASSLAIRAIGHGAPGIIEANTPDEVATAIDQLFANPQRSIELGKKGREFVERQFSWNAAVEKLEAIYNELLAKKH
jgi:glycosyltransferase involved in cell wall biosynthesis